MTDKLFNILWDDALTAQNREAYVSDWSLSPVMGRWSGSGCTASPYRDVDTALGCGPLVRPGYTRTHWAVPACVCHTLLHFTPDGRELGERQSPMPGLYPPAAGAELWVLPPTGECLMEMLSKCSAQTLCR